MLLTGTMLCNGPRTVAAALRVMGLSHDKRFGKYHRVLSHARWSGLLGAKILLGMLIRLIPHSLPIVVGIDETIERRKGKKITAKGVYRDAVRSSSSNVVKCFGLKWILMMLIIPVPWSKRFWALPFLTILAPSKEGNEADDKRHKTTIDWAIQMVYALSRWVNDRWCIVMGDGAYACVRFAWACKKKG